MLRLRVLQGPLGGGLAGLGALLAGGGVGLAQGCCVLALFRRLFTVLCLSRTSLGCTLTLGAFLSAVLRCLCALCCRFLTFLCRSSTVCSLFGIFPAHPHAFFHAGGRVRCFFSRFGRCFLTGLGRVHALQRLFGVLRHLGHELFIDARRNALGGRVGVDGVIAGVLAGLGHGSVAAVVDGQQHPGALFFQCPAPVYQCAVVLVQDLRVRLCAAQALHMQGHGAVLPLFRQLKAKLVHLGAPHTAQIQRLNVCPERRTVVLQLSDLDIQLAHSFTPFLPLSYHAPPGATTPDIHKFPPLDKYVKYVYNQITNEERRIPPPCR